MNLKLIRKVIQWGVEKKITGPDGKGTIEGQFWKFIEEMHELGTAIKANDRKEIRDAIGDLQVVAIQANSIIRGHETFPCEYPYQGISSTLIGKLSTAVQTIEFNGGMAFTCIRSFSYDLGHDPDECLQEAYDVISKRTGKMVGGTFCKDA